LMERHLPAVRRMLLFLFRGNPDDVMDAEQEILSRLLADASSLRPRRDVAAFLRSYARHKAVDILRRRDRERRLLSRLRPDPEPDPEETAALALDFERLAELASWRGPKDRALLYLAEIEGLSIRDAASACGMSEGNAKTRLCRARKRLAEWMQGGFHVP